ncbi:MAG: hypothetical protein KGL48_05100 [Sphingomonadales bacterium]|nr:hypothetical protein [Sphingomonadales bacterium]MDE2568700.1 hypothetical protein [Sphingomonadales bacterium]
MSAVARALRVGTAGVALLALAGASPERGPPASDPQSLAYSIEEGRNLNAFLRDGPVAAHLLLRSGHDPHLIVAFPAGNSGVGVWFDRLAGKAQWQVDSSPVAVTSADGEGRALRGITATVSIDAPDLRVRGAVLSSVRVLRDYELSGKQPEVTYTGPKLGSQSVGWERDRLDGAPGYRLTLDVLDGRIVDGRIVAVPGGRIRIRLVALTGEKPLTPLAGAALLNSRAGDDPAARHALEFLSYREKFLAGSWRFDTYFGRDTLMSVRLLMPALTPRAIDAGLGSVLARLSPQGEVAHEEDVGEFAVLDHMRTDGTRSAAPVYDYKMVDETAMLAPVITHWLLDDPRARDHAAAFLAQDASNGRSNGAALAANLLKVVSESASFAADPRASHLVALKPGVNVGNWRDSEDGLGGGRFAYDVNAVLVPAALQAAARLEASRLLDPWLDASGRAKLRRAGEMARIWQARAPAMFDVRLPPAEARHAVAAAARKAGVSDRPALAAMPHGEFRFSALSLDGNGKPVGVLHSDEAFALLFSNPSPGDLDWMVATMMRPFPAGLMSDAGLFVANPAFASRGAAARFTPEAYHGEVVWSWQHALLLAGLDRQLARNDLPPAIRMHLTRARRQISSVIARTRKWRNSELWSWRVEAGKIEPSAFGASDRDADESNAAQLWSTVFLGLTR